MPPLSQLLSFRDFSGIDTSSTFTTSHLLSATSAAGPPGMSDPPRHHPARKSGDANVLEQSFDVVQEQRWRRDRRARSKSMTIPEELSSSNSLFYKDAVPADEEQQLDETGGGRRGGWHPRTGALGLLSGLISCWQHHKTPEAKAWEKRRALALMELSKRQQAALADKQDTIDMLEWQLEQLQAMAGKEHELQEMETAAALSVGSAPSCQKRSSSSLPLQEKENIVEPPGELKHQFQEEDAKRSASNSIGAGEVPPTVLLFEMAVIRARLSIRYFCNVFIKQMEASGYPVCRTLADMEAATTFLRKEHTAFVLDSRINKAFFHCFENDSFDESGVMRILDPAKRCAARLAEYKRMKMLNVAEAVASSSPAFEPDFLRFCQAKTKEMWALFQLNMAFKSVEEREAFTGAFLDVAKGVWLLHRLAFSTNPAVVIIRVGKGMDVNPLYVEPVAAPERQQAAGGGCRKCCNSVPKVEFMIMPGFRAHNKVIKCQVYPHVQCK